MRTDAPVIVRVIGMVDPTSPNPVAQRLHREHAGRYLVAYDPYTKAGDPPNLVTTADRSKAQRFPSLAAWHDLYRTAYGTRPWDGRPNRPITAFNLEITQVSE